MSQPRLHIILKLLLIIALLSVCSGFAGFGSSKPSSSSSKAKGGKKGGKRGAGGFGSKGGTTAPDTGASLPSSQKQTVSLGPDKSVSILVPPNALEGQVGNEDITKFAAAAAAASTEDSSAARSKLLEDFGSYRGTGDVIWPSSLHLSRLVANCPSFVAGRRVLDLGCGLGLASLATLLGGPARLALSDVDEEVLDLAVQSCTDMVGELGAEGTIKAVERMQLDWSERSTWPESAGEFDVLLASDVLYDAEAAQYVAEIMAHLLLPPAGEEKKDDDIALRRALVVDPANRLNRDKFIVNAAKNGLLAEAVPFPGQEQDFVLINVTPA